MSLPPPEIFEPGAQFAVNLSSEDYSALVAKIRSEISLASAAGQNQAMGVPDAPGQAARVHRRDLARGTQLTCAAGRADIQLHTLSRETGVKRMAREGNKETKREDEWSR